MVVCVMCLMKGVERSGVVRSPAWVVRGPAGGVRGPARVVRGPARVVRGPVRVVRGPNDDGLSTRCRTSKHAQNAPETHQNFKIFSGEDPRTPPSTKLRISSFFSVSGLTWVVRGPAWGVRGPAWVVRGPGRVVRGPTWVVRSPRGLVDNPFQPIYVAYFNMLFFRYLLSNLTTNSF